MDAVTLFKDLIEHYEYNKKHGQPTDGLSMIINEDTVEWLKEAVEALSTNKGEWEQIIAKDGEFYYCHSCTNCGYEVRSGFDKPPIFNHCPNCGAKMTKQEGET